MTLAVVFALFGNEARGAEPELEFSLELASAYVFRGYNVFQAESQREQKWVQRPRFVWAPTQTGFSLGYASANQLTGDNLVSNVAAGVGAEQDLFAGYDFARTSPLGVSTELAVVAYPATDSRIAGTTMPWFVSVSAEPHYRRNLYLYVGYLHGAAHGPLGEDQLYFNPRVEERFDVGKRAEVELQVGAGVKVLQLDVGVVRDNMFDVLATAAVYYALNKYFYVGAKIGWAWTNFVPYRSPDNGRSITPGFADEYVPFGALSVGAEFAGDVATRPSPQRHGALTM